MTLSEVCRWDPTISQVSMCTMDNDTIVLRGRQDITPYDYIVKIYSLRGSLLYSWPSKCSHNWSVGIQCIKIDSTNYILESCSKCQQIRPYTKEEGSRRTAYENKNHYPGKMCTGRSADQSMKEFAVEYDEWCVFESDTKVKKQSQCKTLLVCDTKGNDVLELDVSTKKFQWIRSHATGLNNID